MQADKCRHFGLKLHPIAAAFKLPSYSYALVLFESSMKRD